MVNITELSFEGDSPVLKPKAMWDHKQDGGGCWNDSPIQQSRAWIRVISLASLMWRSISQTSVATILFCGTISSGLCCL